MTEFEDALELVRFYARRIHARVYRHIALEDLMQEGVVGLLQAQQRYVPGMVPSLAKFASRRIKGAMYDFVRAQIPGPRHQLRAPEILSLDVPICGEEGDELTIGETLTSADDPERDVFRAEQSRVIASAVEELPARERLLLRRLYFEDRDVEQKDVARELGVSQSLISQLHSSALCRMRRALESCV